MDHLHRFDAIPREHGGTAAPTVHRRAPLDGATLRDVVRLPAATVAALIALALPGCVMCPNVPCPVDTFAWEATVPTSHGVDQVRAGMVRACRNDVCVEREWADESHIDVGSGVSATVWMPDDAVRVEVDWALPLGTATDGDRYSIEILGADGVPIVGLGETQVTYHRVYAEQCGQRCVEAQASGSTL